MKQWAIPVSWEVAGVVVIPANTLEEAIHAAIGCSLRKHNRKISAHLCL